MRRRRACTLSLPSMYPWVILIPTAYPPGVFPSFVGTSREDGSMPSLDTDAVLWSEPLGDKPLVVLLHGYGSDERDLFSLRGKLPDAFTYAAVRAPLDPPFPMSGYSWYPIEGLESRDPAGVTAGARALLDWLAPLGARRVGLIGFSQGGAVSLQAMRLDPERFDFVVNLS